jgi:hypothetical protein
MSDNAAGASGGGAGGAAAASGGGAAGGSKETAPVKGTEVSVQIDAEKVKDLIENKAAATDSPEAAKDTTQLATHAFKVSVDNTTWAAFKTGVGDGSALSGLSVYGDPKSTSSPVSAGVHADLLQMHWHDIAGASLSTTLGDDLKWNDGKNMSDEVNIKQDVTWKSITFEGEISTTIEPGGKVNAQASGTVKFNF